MTALQWDQIGERLYETGTDRGVLYPANPASPGTYGEGVAWNGLTAVTESPSGAEESAQYADNIKYLALRSEEEWAGTIEAFTYPPEFEECDGSRTIAQGVTIGQQARRAFCLSYRSLIGNDTDYNEHGYKLHLIYGLTAAPSERSRQTVNDSPEAMGFSWSVNATKINVPGFKPTASLEIDSTKANAELLASLEAILYGTNGSGGSAGTAPRMPLPAEVMTLMTGTFVLTSDTKFQAGTVYYLRNGSGTSADPYYYTVAAVTPGNDVTANTYYVLS